MFLIINVCRLFLLFPRVTVISFMASEIDRLESSTSMSMIVLMKLLSFGWSIRLHYTDAHNDDGIVFRLNVIGIHVELCLAQFHEKIYCSIRDDIERVPYRQVDSVDFPRSYFFLRP
jgi:hypothetical protein